MALTKKRRMGRAGAVTVAVHAGETVKPATLKVILEQAGLTVEQFAAML